jgi:adenylyltransferase/sulfurtransferase
VTDRQERVPGFDQERFSKLIALLIGAGGLNGEVAEGLVRKGIACLKLCDPDVVEASNLNRQRFFAADVGYNKALALVDNLEPEAIRRTYLVGYPASFQDLVAGRADLACDVAICGVDNIATRIFASEYFRRLRVPLVISGVSEDAGHGYVLVQEPDGACFGCVFPQAVADQVDPCPNTPAIKDILKAVGGYALFAVDSLFMERPRRWNYREVFLEGSSERRLRVERRADCPLCGTADGSGGART